MRSIADAIIEKFGGLTGLAKALGHKHPTTVQGWRRRGLIPAQQQAKVLEAARKKGIALGPSDFFDDASPERSAA